MIKLKIKKGSTVQVITGDDKGKTGSVLDVDPFDMKVKVQGVRIQTKRDKKENTLKKKATKKKATKKSSTEANPA